MKSKVNIFSDIKIEFFLSELFADYQLLFMELNDIEKSINNTDTNIIILNKKDDIKLINFNNLNDNCLILSNLENTNFTKIGEFVKTPVPINYIKNIIENFIKKLKIQFHDIFIINERLTNINNDTFCYLTKIESEILCHLIKEKESSKNYIKENILNIKSTIETNSLDSHLTRIRKKMSQVDTKVKIQSKCEMLLITI